MKRVLCIEDDQFLHELYVQSLMHAGFAVHGAFDAQSAIDELDEHGADIIVMDMMLPAHNGVEIVQELQSHADWQRIPIVIITAQKLQLFSSMQAQLAACSVVELLYKPDTVPAQLVAAVNRGLAHHAPAT